MPTSNEAMDKEFMKQYKTVEHLSSVDFIKIWKHYDKNRTGFLEKNELIGFCGDLLRQDKDKVEEEEVLALSDAVMQLYDVNRDNKISMAELANVLPLERNFLSQFRCFANLSVQNFDDIFQHYDKNGDNSIEEEELEALILDLLVKFGKCSEVKDVAKVKDKIMHHVDLNADGKIQMEELRILFTDPRLQQQEPEKQLCE